MRLFLSSIGRKEWLAQLNKIEMDKKWFLSINNHRKPDFFGIYLAMEGLCLTLYVLASMTHQGIVSIEASIKYFSLGFLESSSGVGKHKINVAFTPGALSSITPYVFEGLKYLFILICQIILILLNFKYLHELI